MIICEISKRYDLFGKKYIYKQLSFSHALFSMVFTVSDISTKLSAGVFQVFKGAVSAAPLVLLRYAEQ